MKSSHKTFYGRNLLMIAMRERVFVAGKPFQPSPMFVGEATLEGRTRNLPHSHRLGSFVNIRLGRNGL
jgi:hypothetical protein